MKRAALPLALIFAMTGCGLLSETASAPSENKATQDATGTATPKVAVATQAADLTEGCLSRAELKSLTNRTPLSVIEEDLDAPALNEPVWDNGSTSLKFVFCTPDTTVELPFSTGADEGLALLAPGFAADATPRGDMSALREVDWGNVGSLPSPFMDSDEPLEVASGTARASGGGRTKLSVDTKVTYGQFEGAAAAALRLTNEDVDVFYILGLTDRSETPQVLARGVLSVNDTARFRFEEGRFSIREIDEVLETPVCRLMGSIPDTGPPPILMNLLEGRSSMPTEQFASCP